jgi:hypothetical protein
MLAVFETGIGEGRERCNRGCRGRMTRASLHVRWRREEASCGEQPSKLQKFGFDVIFWIVSTTCDISNNKQPFPDSARPLHL